ncbi:glycosyltransferase family 4 protein [Enterococcus casseliflavus]|uniref:glycosyltransferase family 4 protein n=1 Tax=Enterococcus casseliflavus TaxID=37734 RepID=UPI003019C5AC
MKRDILFMCQFFYPEYVSSALLPYQTAQGLSKAGLTVDVLCGYPREYTQKNEKIPVNEKIDDMTVYRKKYIQLGRKNFLSRLINYFSFTFTILLNVRMCRNYKTIIVYSNPPILPLISIIAKRLYGCKIVFVAYDLYPEIAERTGTIRKNSFISRFMQKINERLYPEASNIVALSNDMKSYIRKNRNIDPERIIVIPNWATEEKSLNKLVTQEFIEISNKYPLIVSYFGNMGTAQDMDTILKTISDERIAKEKIAFLFAGHGNKKKEISEVITEKSLKNCFMFDYLSGNEFNDALSITSIFIVSLEEGLSGLAVPSKTYSYYQAEKPVIAIMDTNTDIARELLLNNAGIAVHNGDSEELISSLLTLNNDKTTLRSMSKNMSNKVSKNYCRNIQIQKYIKLFKRILEE